MIPQDSLACLDVSLWLGTGRRASQVLNASQSTVSRRSREALELFGLRPEEIQPRPCSPTIHQSGQLGGPGPPSPMADLLAMERELHQYFRLRMGGPLRLLSHYWTRSAFLEPPPVGWLVAPLEPFRPHPDPLGLLRERIVDAALLSGPEVRGLDPAHWRVVDLARVPLQLLVPAHHALARERHLCPSDLWALPSTAFAPMLPVVVRQCMEAIEWQLLGRAAQPLPHSDGPEGLPRGRPAYKCMATPLTLHLWPGLVPVDLALPIPASDHLVTRADLPWGAAFDQLLQHLHRAASGWQRSVPSMTLLV